MEMMFSEHGMSKNNKYVKKTPFIRYTVAVTRFYTISTLPGLHCSNLQTPGTKQESDGALGHMTWNNPPSPNLNQGEMIYNELDLGVKVKHSTSARHL